MTDNENKTLIETLYGESASIFLSQLRNSDLEAIPFSPNTFHTYYFIKTDETTIIIDNDKGMRQAYIYIVGQKNQNQQKKVLSLLEEKTGTHFD